MGDYDPFGVRLVARLKRESEQVHQKRKRLLTNPLIMAPVLLAVIVLTYWKLIFGLIAAGAFVTVALYVLFQARQAQLRWQRLDRVNFTQLDNVSGGDVSVEKEIFGAYLSSWDETLGMLQRALSEQNPQDSKLFSHSMKGACLSIGFTRLSEIFKDMERLSLESRFTEIERLLPLAFEEHAFIKDAMREYFSARLQS